MFEGTAASPQQLWEDVRAGLGERGRALPKHYPLLVTKLLGVSPVLTGRFRIQAPLRASVALKAGELQWVVGLPLHSGSELLAELTTGSGAPYLAEKAEGHVRVHRPGTQEFPARGVSGNWLLLASSADALKLLGAYVGHASIEANIPAPAGSIVLRSLPGAEKRLASWARSWWAASGRAAQQRLLEATLQPALGQMVEAISGVTSQAAAASVELLEATTHSEVSVSMRGTVLQFVGKHGGSLPWQVSSDACEVVARSPFDNTSFATAWGTRGGLSWPLSDRAGLPGAAHGGHRADELRLMGPALLGVAEAERSVAFGQVQLQPTEPRVLQRWFESWLGRSEATAWRVRAKQEPFGTSFRFLPDRGPTNAVQGFEVAVATGEPWTRWVIARDGAASFTRWAHGASRLPWTDDCAKLLFGMSLGVNQSRLGVWAISDVDGFTVQARLPLLAFVEP